MPEDDGGTDDDVAGGPTDGSGVDETATRDQPETLADDVDEERGVDAADDGTGGTANEPSVGTGSAEENTPSVGTGNTGENAPSVGTGSTTENTPTAGTSQTATTGQDGVEATVQRESNNDGDKLLAAIISFFIPGVGNMINGQTERGLIIFVLWVVWLVVAWGIGFFVIGSIFTLVTLGIGAIVWMLAGLVLSVAEFAIHVIAAMDAYNQSELVDSVTVKVNEVRGN